VLVITFIAEEEVRAKESTALIPAYLFPNHATDSEGNHAGEESDAACSPNFNCLVHFPYSSYV